MGHVRLPECIFILNVCVCVCNMSICSSWTNGVALLYQYYCIHTQWVDLRLCAHLKKAPVSISQSKTLRFFAFLPKTGADFGEAFHLWSARPKNQWFTISGGTNPADSSPVSRLWTHPCWLGHLYSTWIANGQQDFLLVFVAFFFYIYIYPKAQRPFFSHYVWFGLYIVKHKTGLCRLMMRTPVTFRQCGLWICWRYGREAKDGIRYVHWPLGNVKEQQGQTKMQHYSGFLLFFA